MITQTNIIDLEYIANEYPEKLDELACLHWFTKISKIKYEGIHIGNNGIEYEESPDFILRIDSKNIGVEITQAHRSKTHESFTIRQIEAAQNAFASALKRAVKSEIPIIINFSFQDNVEVDKAEISKCAINKIAAVINKTSSEMMPPCAIGFVRTVEGSSRATQTDRVCSDIPKFIQSIQISSVGNDFTAVSCSRGAIIDNFTKSDLSPILRSKHNALKNYRLCDEQWLIIVSGAPPPIYSRKEPPQILSSSVATSFSEVDIETPVQSEFNRVYFFKCPYKCVLLTS